MGHITYRYLVCDTEYLRYGPVYWSQIFRQHIVTNSLLFCGDIPTLYRYEKDTIRRRKSKTRCSCRTRRVCGNIYIMQIQEIRAISVPILKRRAVKRAGIFGSSARGEARPRDVDLLVDLPRPYGLFSFLSLKQELEEALGTGVDLVSYSSLKPRLRERILRDEVALL